MVSRRLPDSGRGIPRDDGVQTGAAWRNALPAATLRKLGYEVQNKASRGGDSSDNSHPYQTIAVCGAGSWGTALAVVLARGGADVRLWGRNAPALDAMKARRENAPYLPGVELPGALSVVADMAAALDGAEAVLLATPSHTLRSVSKQVAAHIGPSAVAAVCSKGVEAETGALMTQIAEEELPGRPVGVISGPTFAKEAALDHPTAAVVAFPFRHVDRLSPERSPAVRLALSLSTKSFRAYISDDHIGVEVCGAVKNVIAIACGIMSGAGFAENTRAALITRGVDEMKRLAEVLGGRRETVTGLAGVGDLTLTCSSATSRNMSLGQQLGRGLTRAECFGGEAKVVEGERNARSVIELARRVGISMPICEAVHEIVNGGADVTETIAALWARPIEAEPRSLDLIFPHPEPSEAERTVMEMMS